MATTANQGKVKTQLIFALSNRAAGAGLQLAANVFVGRLLGTSGAAVIFFLVAATQVLATVVGAGLPMAALRDVSAHMGNERPILALGVWRRSLRITLFTSSGMALLATVIVAQGWLAAGVGHSPMRTVVSMLAITVPAFSVIRLAAEAIKGYGLPAAAMSVQFALPPGILLLALALFGLGGSSAGTADVAHAFAISVGSVAIVSIAFAETIFRHATPGGNANGVTPRPKAPPRRSVWSNLRFLGIELLQQTHSRIPIVILPLFSTATEVARFGAASQLVSVSTLVLVALAGVYSPMFSQAFAKRDGHTLRQQLHQTRLVSSGFFVPLLLIGTLLGRPFLALFGPGFSAGWPILMVLMVSQGINAITGLVTYLNIMTHEERFELRASAMSGAALLVLIFFLGTLQGALGVAIAVAVAMVTKNLVSLHKARRTILKLVEGVA